MENMLQNFASRFSLTDEGQQALVVEPDRAEILKTPRFLLVGKVLLRQEINKEAFKRTMPWRPQAEVTIADLEANLFVFSFKKTAARATILWGGPWTFNHFLLVLAEIDDLVYPTRILLCQQEF
ncbi:hypothetical protein GBA52_010490 [Prunus armeniaca]|nr:hypothetical protein GBA52_010490 [Prunus armeniaca]